MSAGGRTACTGPVYPDQGNGTAVPGLDLQGDNQGGRRMVKDTRYTTNRATQGRYLMRPGRKSVPGRTEHAW